MQILRLAICLIFESTTFQRHIFVATFGASHLQKAFKIGSVLKTPKER